MLCESAERPPAGREWQYELKLDGFRAIGRKAGRVAQLWSRNQKNFARHFPSVVKGLAGLPGDTVIDGEIVALELEQIVQKRQLDGIGAKRADSACRSGERIGDYIAIALA